MTFDTYGADCRDLEEARGQRNSGAAVTLERTYDKYAANCGDLREARTLVEGALPINFALHESMYWGGEYYRSRSPEYGEITIRPNYNTFTKKLDEPQSPEGTFIVAVNAPPDPDAVKERLIAAGLSFLRRSVVTAPERPRKNRQ